MAGVQRSCSQLEGVRGFHRLGGEGPGERCSGELREAAQTALRYYARARPVKARAVTSARGTSWRDPKDVAWKSRALYCG